MSRSRLLSPRIHRAASILLLAMYALVATFGGALVVCAEDGGDVAFEWRDAGCCDDGHRTVRGADPAALVISAPADSSDCGPCEDAPVSDLLASREWSAKQAPVVPPADVLPPALPVAPHFVTWTLPSQIERAGPCVAPLPPPPLPRVGTVVLRC
jgi:hypothetical protein